MKTIQERLPNMFNILQLARQHVYDSKSLICSDTTEEHLTIRRSKFLMRTQVSLYILAIIETSKIFGRDGDYYNLHKVINIVKHGYQSVKTKISKEQIADFENQINSEKVKKSISKLHELRDEHYAHSDKTPQNDVHGVGLYYDELLEIIELAEKICCTLSEKLYDEQRITEIFDRNGVKSLVKKLTEYNRLKSQEIINRTK